MLRGAKYREDMRPINQIGLGVGDGEEFPFDRSEVGKLIRARDWSKTSLGPIDTWPTQLRAAVTLTLPAHAPIVLFWGPEFIALYNDAYAPTIGARHPSALGRPAREHGEEVWDELEPVLRGVRQTGKTVFGKDRPMCLRRDGHSERAYFDISYSAVRLETGVIDGVLCIANETTERVVAQQKFARTRERLNQALNAAGMVGIYDWDVQTDTVYSDSRFAEIFSVDPAKAERGAPASEYRAGIHPDDVERIAAAVTHTVLTGDRFIQEYRLLGKDSRIHWVEARGEIVYDEYRKPSRLVGVVVDITNQKEAQERQRLLLRETNHRLKNLFAMIDALIMLSVRSARTPQEFADSLRGRLIALLKAKELVRPGFKDEDHVSERTTVCALIRAVLKPYDDAASRERITVSGPEVEVGPNAVTSLALALHETATNAVKYGALSKPGGAIRVTWEMQDDSLHLVWEEFDGPEILVPSQSPGFGTYLTQRSIVNQLGGKLDCDWQRSGLKLRLQVPLSQLRL
jgi:two-component sensor histidine kinase